MWHSILFWEAGKLILSFSGSNSLRSVLWRSAVWLCLLPWWQAYLGELCSTIFCLPSAPHYGAAKAGVALSSLDPHYRERLSKNSYPPKASLEWIWAQSEARLTCDRLYGLLKQPYWKIFLPQNRCGSNVYLLVFYSETYAILDYS